MTILRKKLVQCKMNPMVEITPASSAFVRTNANFALQNACKSQTLSDLHRSGAGYAFLPNAFECVNAHSLRKFGSLFGASVNGITPMFVIE